MGTCHSTTTAALTDIFMKKYDLFWKTRNKNIAPSATQS